MGRVRRKKRKKGKVCREHVHVQLEWTGDDEKKKGRKKGRGNSEGHIELNSRKETVPACFLHGFTDRKLLS